MSIERIRQLNDCCRVAWGVYPNSRVVMTSGIRAMPQHHQAAIAERVQKFNAFTAQNNPHNEHDFGAFDYAGSRIFWKIDYYALNLEEGSENPADPTKTVRVLTIMRADEY